MPSNNIVVISAAGSRKTSYIIEESINKPNEKILLLTYTIDNLTQIKNYFIEKKGHVPSNVRIQSWFSFLLQECVRPYQNFLHEKRVENIFFIPGKSPLYIKREDTQRYYFANQNRIYTDKISEFVCRCNEKSEKLIIKRLENIYTHIYIDEIQDLAGYDFEVLELLFQSKISITCVGDSRQATYVTNHSARNKKFKGQNIINLFRHWENKGLCIINERDDCYRCNQSICDFADSLYPEMSTTNSKQTEITEHDGLFLIRRRDLQSYLQKYKPRVLRYKVNDETAGLNALNFGLSKGQTFDRILIFPTKGIKEYLTHGKLEKVGDKPKFYVAVTRAKYSVAFVHDEECFFKQFNVFQP